MQLFDLRIYHLPIGEKQAQKAFSSLIDHDHYLYFESCIRSFAVGLCSDHDDHLAIAAGVETISGIEAYAWLLAVACGLHSHLPGETEIFSQIKEQWSLLIQSGQRPAKYLRPLMDRLFTDVKSIRASHLQGIGTTSYGSLVRRILNPTESDRVVIIGAGQLAETITSYFSKHQLHIWNRDFARLNGLMDKMGLETNPSVSFSACEDLLLQKTKDADAIIFCTPHNLSLEARIMDGMINSAKATKIIHLGANRSELSHMLHNNDFWSLDDIFKIQHEQNEIKLYRVKAALLACKEKAHTRALFDGIANNHGWEDLASFSR